MDVHASALVSDATLDVLGVGLGASGADVLVSVQGDGVIQFDAAKEVRPALTCRRRRARPHRAARSATLTLTHADATRRRAAARRSAACAAGR